MLTSTAVASTGEATPTLRNLAVKIREAHADVVASLSSVAERAIAAGKHLAQAKKLVSHGQWIDFLGTCDVNDRTARRYMQLAELTANRSPTTDLVGMSIEGAIKYLVPPKASTREATAPKHTRPERLVESKRGTHFDIIAAWANAPAEERKKALHSIGLKPLLAALPEDWIASLEAWLVDRRLGGPTVTASAHPASEDVAPLEAPNADAEASGDLEAEDETEGLPPKKRDRKVTVATEIVNAITDSYVVLEELAGECRGAVENVPDGLRETQRNQALEASANDLESLDAPDVPAALSDVSVKYSLPNLRRPSRQARASNAATILEACIDALENIPEGDKRHADAQGLIEDLRSATDTIEMCEFPGMYG